MGSTSYYSICVSTIYIDPLLMVHDHQVMFTCRCTGMAEFCEIAPSVNFFEYAEILTLCSQY